MLKQYHPYIHLIATLWFYHSALGDLMLRTMKKSLSDFDGDKIVKDTIKQLTKHHILTYYPETGKDLMHKTFTAGFFDLNRV